MNFRLVMTVVSTTALVLAPAAFAKSAKAKRQPAKIDSRSSQSGPRMIEVRPGTWVSSWGCVMDDGKRGLMPCSSSGDIN